MNKQSKTYWQTLKFQYQGVYRELQSYWIQYGGIKALITSPFLHVSILITILCYPLWFNQQWWENVISIMPNLLGFTLAGYAIWLAIGDGKFREILSGSTEEKTSPFMSLNYSFLHFIFIQILALIYAILVSGFSAWGDFWPKEVVKITGLIGYLLFIYAIFSAFATVLAIVRYSRWYDGHIRRQKDKSLETKQTKPKD